LWTYVISYRAVEQRLTWLAISRLRSSDRRSEPTISLYLHQSINQLMQTKMQNHIKWRQMEWNRR